MDIKEAIRARHSTRRFIHEPLPASVAGELPAICNAPDPLKGELARIVIADKAAGGRIGTYGVISGAEHFLVLCYGAGSPLAPVNAGMKMERAVLWLTARGIATCWLGGTFSAGDASRFATPAPGEHIPAVVAFGLGAEKDTFFSHIAKWAVQSRRRKPFGELFQAGADSPFREALEMMRLAPSSLNSQPWRALATGRRVDFYITKDTDAARMDLGIGLCHFALTAPAGRWTNTPSSTLPNHHYVISYII